MIQAAPIRFFHPSCLDAIHNVKQIATTMADSISQFKSAAIHVIVAELRGDLSSEDLEFLHTSAYTLKKAPAVHNVSVGLSDTHFIVSIELLLSGPIEEFSDSSTHMEFVVHSLGKYITGMWSVDFQCDGGFPTANEFFPQAKSVAAIAVKGGARVFEWQITEWFQELETAIPNSIIASGHTIEERDLHRACALIFSQIETTESSQTLSEIITTLGIPIGSLEIATASLSQLAS